MDEQNKLNLSGEAQGAAEVERSEELSVEVSEAQAAVSAEKSGEQGKEVYVPRPLWQRVLAWVGVVYVIVVMLLMAAFMTRGEQLTNIGWLMITPILVAAAIFLYLTYGKGKGRGGMPMLFLGEAALIYLIYSAVTKGIPALIAQLS